MSTIIDYQSLNPDRVLSAVDSAGFQTDGRMLEMNSFENRVFQIGLETGQSIVAKFYRPERWSDAAILENMNIHFSSRVRRYHWSPQLLMNGVRRCDILKDSDFPFLSGKVVDHPTSSLTINCVNSDALSVACMRSANNPYTSIDLHLTQRRSDQTALSFCLKIISFPLN